MNKKMFRPLKAVIAVAGTLALQFTAGCASQPDSASGSHAGKLELSAMPAVGVKLDGANAVLSEVAMTPDRISVSDSDIWARMRKGFALDLDYDNPRIKVQRDWYARNQAYLDRVAKRASRYMHYIVAEAEKRDIPLELALLPVVESAFDPFAYSHGSASGPWQFISSTGRIFGLRQDWWYDGRRDILESTRAAYDYLESLSKRFDGDWLLALASYNCGSGTVSRAINRNRAAGKKTDFWSLRLPRETRAYAPKLLAIAQIVKDPAKYGIQLQTIEDEAYFEVVELPGQMDLAQAADLAGISLKELHLLNPGFNRWATAPEGPHRLLVPATHAEPFREKLTALSPEHLVQWDRYTIRSGDNLIGIARKFRTTAEVLKTANRLRNHRIIAGQTLLIPRPAKPMDQYTMTESARLKARQDRAVPGRKRVDHVVRPGDTLWDIAQSYGVGVRALAKWNKMAPRDSLKVGQNLAVWTSKPYAVRQSPVDMVRKVRYSVRRGDSLWRIAGKFNVSINQIRKWNTLDRNRYLHPGQRLTLYVDIRDAY